MDHVAINTIRVQNWGMSITRAKRVAMDFLNLLSIKYPTGLGEEVVNPTYFVMPGFEHVTKNQPIGVYNGSEGCWELSTSTLFVEPNQ